jgi:starch phosphorylase
MSQQTRPNSLYTHHAAGIEGFDSLAELALNLRWSWNHATDEVWGLLDRKLWDITNNPWVVLQTASSEKIQEALGDPAFRKRVDELITDAAQVREVPAWFF